MPVSITLQEIPIGSAFVSAIVGEEKATKNDFKVLILTSENGTGLEESDITLSTGASLVSLTGDGVTREAVIRPPETAGTLTLTIAANAFTEGNAQTSKDIRLSTSFPDTDAETTTQLFSSSGSARRGITITPTRIIVLTSLQLKFYTHAGVEQTAEQISFAGLSKLDFINGDLLAVASNDLLRYRLDGVNTLIEIRNYFTQTFIGGITHSDLGIVVSISGNVIIQKHGETNTKTIQYPQFGSGTASFTGIQKITDTHYFLSQSNSTEDFALLTLTDDADFERLRYLNIEADTDIIDTALYGDTLYILHQSSIHTFDIRRYRPLSLNTKTTIYPVFANEGETIPLKQYCPDAHTITFGTGFDKPTYLSINADNELEIASNAVSETQPVLVRLTGINYIDSVDFSFYLIIVPASSPTWRDVESLSMKANTTYDLHPIVDADSIAFEPGETQPTGSSMSNGVFTIATTAGAAYFRATKGGLTTDKAIQIDVIQEPNPDNFSDIFRYKVEIAGIDVSSDLIKDAPTRVTKSLDDVELTRYRAHSVTVPLQDTDGKYSPDLAGNFWETNNLNPGGYQEEIKVYRESFISDAWVESLMFVGIN